MAKKEEKKDDKKGKEPATPEEQAAAAKKKKIIIAAVAGLLVVGGGAFAALKFLGSSDKTPAKDQDTELTEQSSSSEEGDSELDAIDGDADGKASGSTDGTSDKTQASKDSDSASKTKDDSTQASSGKTESDSKASTNEKSDTVDKNAAANSKDSGGTQNSGRYSGIGLMYDMKPFHLNLGNPLENRYIRLEVRFEYPNEDQKPELTARNSQIRDAIVSIVSRKTREHLLSPDGKDQLRLEIKNRVNQYLEKKITNVYITDILIE
jgi:flagellar protein FliL